MRPLYRQRQGTGTHKSIFYPKVKNPNPSSHDRVISHEWPAVTPRESSSFILSRLLSIVRESAARLRRLCAGSSYRLGLALFQEALELVSNSLQRSEVLLMSQ